MRSDLPRVLVADQLPVVREGVKRILSRSDLAVAGEAGSGREVLDKIKNEEFDLLVLDTSWPDVEGLEVLRLVKNECPPLTVLMMGVQSEEFYGPAALEIGAAGYLEKDAQPEEFHRAIRQILTGRVYLSERLAEFIAKDLAGGEPNSPAELSEQEFEVMRQLASGKRITEIARNLCMNVKTVSTCRARIMQKLSVRSTAEVILCAVQEGIE